MMTIKKGMTGESTKDTDLKKKKKEKALELRKKMETMNVNIGKKWNP